MNPLRTDVTAPDVASFRRWSSATGRGRRVADVICTIMLLGGALIGVSLDYAFSWLAFAGFVLSAGAINANALRRRHAETARTVLLLPTLSGTYTFDDSEVRIDTLDGAQPTYPWASLHRVAATTEFIYLVPTAATGWIIPKRCFESSAEADQFFEDARNRVRDARVDH